MTHTDRMSSLGRACLRMCASLVLLACAMLTAQAGSVPGGIGGTGLLPGGIGGTGFQPGGIGGTGIVAVGPIQRFGSVFVLGKEYHFTPQTVFIADGATINERQLRLGEAVTVIGRRAHNRWVALRVEANSTLIGRIDRVDPERQRIQVLGQTVQIRPKTRFYGKPASAGHPMHSLHPGDLIRVSALGHDHDGWIASAITRLASSTQRTAPLRLHGSIEALTANREAIRIGNTWFRLTQPLARDFATGQRIMAAGHYEAGRPVLTAIKPESSPTLAIGQTIELYGLIRKTPEGVYCNDYRLEGHADLPQGADTHQSATWGVVEGHIAEPGVIQTHQIAPQVDPMAFGLNDGQDHDRMPQGTTPSHSGVDSRSDATVSPATEEHERPHPAIKTPAITTQLPEHPDDVRPDSPPPVDPAQGESGIPFDLPEHHAPAPMQPSVSVNPPDTTDIPDLTPPSMPSTPSAPSVPAIPSVPSAPSVPSMPGIPSIPSAPPEVPELPESPN